MLVDSPALLAVGDTTALAAEVDGLIFLVDMEKARRQVLQASADQLYRLPCAMLGVAVRLPTGSGRSESTTTATTGTRTTVASGLRRQRLRRRRPAAAARQS